MLTTLFENVYIFLSLVNRARYISLCIILNDNNIFNLQLVNNHANNYSNLLLTRCKYNSI